MDEAVSAAEANRKFSSILRGVREGRSFVITSRGRAVARIVPVDALKDTAPSAKAALLARLEGQPVGTVGHWSRAELYEDGA